MRLSLVLLVVALYLFSVSWGSLEPHVLSQINVHNIQTETVVPRAKATITVTPAVITNGGYVFVSFTTTSPDSEDWIAAYSPSNVDITKTAPIKYQYAKKSPGYLTTGTGTLRFNLINMRSDYVFVYFSNGLSSPIRMATSNVVTFQKLNEPLKPRLSTTTHPTEMRLMWSSATTNNPVVRYGTQSGLYTNIASGSTSTYSRGDMCYEPAISVGYRDVGPIHQAVMTDLVPGTRYYYRFGQGSDFSDEFSFKQPPALSPDQKVTLLAFGDMGQSTTDDSLQHYDEPPSINTTKYMTQEVLNGDIDAIFHVGDVSYARGYASEWDMFLDQIAPLASRSPYFICLGNHEMDSPHSPALFGNNDSGGECGVPAEHLFHNPHATLKQPWYSVDIGSVHAVFMSTEHTFAQGTPQYVFLEQDLASVNRSKTSWVVFSGHRPMYIDSKAKDKPASDQVVAKLLRQYIEPLLMKYKVDLGFWGHHHSYQRMCAVYKERCYQKSSHNVYAGPYKAPIHVVIGMAGQGLSTNIEDSPPPYAEYVNDHEYGYTKLHFHNSTTFHMEFFSNSLNGKVREEFWITRS